MYTVVRKDGKIFVLDANDKPVYASSENGYIIYLSPGAGTNTLQVSRVKGMTDEQLLYALAKAIKLGD